jgi:hypothetical protein
MKIGKRNLLVLLITFCFYCCASNQNIQVNFPQEMAAVYYQKRSMDADQSKMTMDLYIEFAAVLANEIQLQKVYFNNQEAVLDKVDEKKYVAHFLPLPYKHDLIFDRDSSKEYGNKAPIILQSKFKLKRDEALLEYTKNNETFFVKFAAIKEKK